MEALLTEPSSGRSERTRRKLHEGRFGLSGWEERGFNNLHPEDQKSLKMFWREVCLWDSWVWEYFVHGKPRLPRNPWLKERKRRIDEGLILFGNTYPYKELMELSDGVWDKKLKSYLLPSFDVVRMVRRASMRRNPESILRSERHDSGYLGWRIIDKARRCVDPDWMDEWDEENSE